MCFLIYKIEAIIIVFSPNIVKWYNVCALLSKTLVCAKYLIDGSFVFSSTKLSSRMHYMLDTRRWRWKWKLKVKSLSRVRLFVTPWTAAYQAPPSMGFLSKSTGVGCHWHWDQSEANEVKQALVFLLQNLRGHEKTQ